MELTMPLKLLVSLLIGAAIGLEREIHEKHDEEHEVQNKLADIAFIGIRTLSLTTALGTLAGILYGDYSSIFLFIVILFGLLLLIHYALSVVYTKDLGVTTEIATIYCFLIGIALGVGLFPIQLILGMTVFLMLILSSKDTIKEFVNNIKRRELRAIISYSLISLVILPSLPNEAITVASIPYAKEILYSIGLSFNTWKSLELINPFSMWMIVAIFTGVDFLGYVLERTIGAGKGLLLSSMVGGFVSSTATTQAHAVQSRQSKSSNELVAASLIATLASYFSLLLIVLPLNAFFVGRIFPTLLILIVGFAIATIIFLKLSNENKSKKISQKKQSHTVFSLKPAITFACLYIAIKLVSKIALQLFGQSGFLVTSTLAAFTGIDAVTINIAELSKSVLQPFTAVFAFILVNAVNLIAKTIYIYVQGSREMAWKYGISIGAIIAASFAGLLFV